MSTALHSVMAPARNGKSMQAEVVTITPEMAARWLEANVNNRTPIQFRIKAYADEMRAGRWRLTHQGIAFDELGHLSDGQNRLMAIVEAGVPVRMWVFRGVPRESMDAIDIGKNRTAADTLHFLGETCSRDSVAVARAMLAAYRVQRGATYNIRWHTSNETLRLFHRAMHEAIDFGSYTPKIKRIGHACFAAAIACAWWTEDKGMLQAFKDHVASGVVTSDSDNAAIRIRELLLSGTLASGGNLARTELFLRSCTALRAYLERRPLSKLYCRQDSAFPLPDVDGVQ